ncbi:hypothetical protein NDN08_006203 [Rhodosorus marinus]|uniref:Tetrapyrrole biosynthesis uroporphyrinogen III synthase domain-containing protein n=1 Tax=Rhodosorus marinus TaxID=101924 RepID=A0AAV8UK14_9RHOD|nr:hypothetical protein NDN08_006203 [Rhodosorus marinus]
MGFVGLAIPNSRALRMRRSVDMSNLSFSTLNGKRVAFTTQPGYATRFSALITEAGARPVWCPTVQTKHFIRDEDFSELDKAVLLLGEYDIVIFTSRNSIDAFYQRLLKWGEGDPEIAQLALLNSKVKLAVIGRDAYVLKRILGRSPDIAPIDPSLPGLVHHLSGTSSLIGNRILCLIPKVTGLTEPASLRDFAMALEHGGASVEIVNACKTVATKPEETELERKQIVSGNVDVLAMTSFEEAEAFGKLVNPDDLPAKLILAALGPDAEFGARCAGFEVNVVSSYYSEFEGLIQRIGMEMEKKNPPTSLILPE